ncbi:thermonuclease family protein [Afifella marina]|uniref:Nuclease homologue n=1 Tax=Afifella marina DSM 2698 TaxID=1120955 RepID=A0A1G5MZ87_AFIMA|nr:thermonuclease family protein [Afifella marina]MBK1622192.1 hypothetical protein [Afifella marina DSM 2698]MBK1628317.1 hypothetical protein [Afifella marina]MBK5918976.1 hypothetical protein [Afifella marina]RAI20282.1 hypothetical protein CH311_10705 [Afifella marina DSM 2698]SCZ30204.1 nuclease homologue [Afifella marina DSM 2698]
MAAAAGRGARARRERHLNFRARRTQFCGALLCLSLVASPLPARADICKLSGGESLFAAHAEEPRTIVTQTKSFALAGIAPPSLLDERLPDAAMLAAINNLLASSTARAVALSEKPDRWNRIPVWIISDAAFLQEELLRQGLAVAVPFAGDGLGETCATRLFAAEEEARKAGRGIWKTPGLVRQAKDVKALSSQYGRYGIVEGTIISVGDRPYRTYLNFGRDWSHDFTAEIDGRDVAVFGGEQQLLGLVGKTVRLRGFLDEKGGPMLLLRRSSQLEMMDALQHR